MVAAQAKALIEARYIMAERHPRDLDMVRGRLMKECRRPGFAAVARYVKPIGKGVEGPSIRFVESAIRLMSNISVDQIAIYDDREKRVMRIIVTDCESNTPYSTDVNITKTVERRTHTKHDEVIRTRTNKNGDLLYTIVATEDDLANKQNAQASKAIRNNGLRLIPRDIVDECMDEVKKIQANQDAQDPGAARRKIFDAFGSIGVPVDQLKQYLGHNAEVITQQEILNLRGLYFAIRDGETTWREVMEELAELKPSTTEQKNVTTSKTEEVKQQLKKKKPAEKLTQVQDIWPKREPGDKEEF